MAYYRMGGSKHPINALYYGITGQDTGGYNGYGSFQIVVTDDPDSCRDWEMEKYRVYMSPSSLSPAALKAMERIAGLGSFDSVPTPEQVSERLESFVDNEP